MNEYIFDEIIFYHPIVRLHANGGPCSLFVHISPNRPSLHANWFGGPANFIHRNTSRHFETSRKQDEWKEKKVETLRN
jgi:hypothetical protein